MMFFSSLLLFLEILPVVLCTNNGIRRLPTFQVKNTPITVQCATYQKSACSCELTNGEGLYDLRPLVAAGSTPHFTTVNGNQTFKYDPCKSFNVDDIICQNVAICKEEPLKSDEDAYFYQNLGTLESIKFVYDERTGQSLILNYNNGKSGASQVESNVVLICDLAQEKPLFELYVNTAQQYDFSLTSKESCLRAPPPGKKLSFGSILCIFVSVSAFLYFIIGFLYLFFVKHESGTRAVPHYKFWSDLPVLVKEGAVFTRDTLTGKTSPSSGSATTYDSI